MFSVPVDKLLRLVVEEIFKVNIFSTDRNYIMSLKPRHELDIRRDLYHKPNCPKSPFFVVGFFYKRQFLCNVNK